MDVCYKLDQNWIYCIYSIEHPEHLLNFGPQESAVNQGGH